MNKNLLPLVALALAALSAPAFATHPNEVCHVHLDIAAIAPKAGVSPSSVRVRYVFHTNMTDMNPPKPEIVTRPARGPWIYKADGPIRCEQYAD
ncbi:MAG: hypothetical protein KGJ84_13425 [Elusimicrobia bacterium]|nr:hypothetical protein [Elusimicrobiota bacterium]